MSHPSHIAAALTVATALVAPLPAPQGGNSNPNIAPINSSTHGRSYGEWGGAWWNWALQFPWASSPLNPADDGTWTMQRQSGPVFFLAGTTGGPAERSVKIEPGKSIFFPVVNIVEWAPEDALTEAGLRTKAHNAIDPFAAAGQISCTIDGREVKSLTSYRAESPAGGFAIDLPPENIFGSDPWVRNLAVADGYCLMLHPLAPGLHTVRFKAGEFLDVTYEITVQRPDNQ